MPLTVTDYSWKQTEAAVYINIHLKGVRFDRVDILSTDEYFKVHFPPYLFEAFLFQPVDDVRGTAKFENGVALFKFPKRSSQMWESLMITTYDKEKQREVRESALVKYREKLSSQSTSKTSKERAERKYALETMMKLEQEGRDAIQKVKETEREKTTVELEAWRRGRLGKGAAEEEEVQSQRDDLSNSGRSAAGRVERRHAGNSDAEKLPAQRHFGNIQVKFTPRVFPTPLRESRAVEEEEWSRKQAEARRAGSTDADELEEHDADWLKDKGDKCFVAGDFLGAANAYDLAIGLNGRIPALYSNRAACHLKRRNLHKAVQDASQALDLLTPPVAANAAARTRAHVRRGSAFCELQLYAEGLQDYQAALEIDPHNEVLQADAQRIRDRIPAAQLS
ncbi:dynein axonemal assembly factor 4 [Brachionichthys hirsutus]|uniref:dynein axonemal assembly factor 4 n=1 Tax=Brachionichthys hirsutus TaxID=412623 RepID=UPI003604F9EB